MTGAVKAAFQAPPTGAVVKDVSIAGIVCEFFLIDAISVGRQVWTDSTD